MKSIFIIIALSISMNIFSQQKRMFQKDFAPFTIKCEKIGRDIITKSSTTNLKEWYEGNDFKLLASKIESLETIIDKSKFEVTYYLSLMRDEPLLYIFHFYNKETKEEFGQLQLVFKNKENTMIDHVNVLSKEDLEELSKKPSDLNDLPNIPDPPKKKKN